MDQFKAVLATELQYEKTPCPFKRGFTVDLPDPPKDPIQKKPWRPVPRDRPSENIVTSIPEDFGYLNIVDEHSVQRVPSHSQVEAESSDSGIIATKTADYPADSQDRYTTQMMTSEANSEMADDMEGFRQKDLYEKVCEKALQSRTPSRPRRVVTGRTVTAPPHLSFQTSPPSSSSRLVATVPASAQESSSFSSSVDSFHSFHSPISPLPRSPPSPDAYNLEHATGDLPVSRTRGHNREESQATITESSRQLCSISGTEVDQLPDRPRTPALTSDTTSQDEEWEQIKTPSPPGLRVRQNVVKKRRNLSPLPSSTNIYTPYSPRRNMSGHHLTTAILQRTCSLLLGPPIQLVALMLRIAAKIARGAFRGESFGWGDGGQKIPCSWDFSDGSDGEVWEEDDYGVALGKTSSGKEVWGQEVGGSWEID